MNFHDQMNAALKGYLVNNGCNVAEVISFEEDIYTGGGCETCAYDEIRVLIHYRDTEGNQQGWTVYNSLAELLNALANDWPS